MKQKKIIDLLDGFDAKKVQGELQEKLFKAEQIKESKTIDPMAIALSVMSNPKKLKGILLSIAITSITGTITILYFTITGAVALIEYLVKNI